MTADVERSVIGELVLDSSRFEDVRAIIGPEAFADSRHRVLFEEIGVLVDSDVAVSFITLGERLKARNEFASVGGSEYLVELGEGAPTSSLLLSHAQVLAEQYAKRRAVDEARQRLARLGEVPAGEGLVYREIERTSEALRLIADRPNTECSPIRHRTASDIEPRAVHWLWEGRMPLETLTLFGGDPGLGKSWVALFCAAVVSRGGTWPDGTRAPKGRVVILSGEDCPETTIVPRLRACGADLDQIEILGGVRDAKDRPVNLAEDIQRIDKTLRGWEDVLLFIVDPVTAYMGHVIDSNQDAKVRGVLMPLMDMARKRGIAVLVVMHLNKNEAAALVYRYSGSIGFVGAARSAMLFHRDPEVEDDDGPRLFGQVKGNLGPPPPVLAYSIRLGGDGLVRPEWEPDIRKGSMREILGKHGRALPRDEAVTFLLTKLERGPCLAHEIYSDGEAAGHSKSTLKRARTLIRSVPYQAKDRRWYWSPPVTRGGN